MKRKQIIYFQYLMVLEMGNKYPEGCKMAPMESGNGIATPRMEHILLCVNGKQI